VAALVREPAARAVRNLTAAGTAGAARGGAAAAGDAGAVGLCSGDHAADRPGQRDRRGAAAEHLGGPGGDGVRHAGDLAAELLPWPADDHRAGGRPALAT